MHRALTDKNEEAKIIEWICQNDKEFDDAKSRGYDLRMDESEIIYWMDKYAKGGQIESDVIKNLKDLAIKLKDAEKVKCVCSGWVIQYEQGCQCGAKAKVRELRQKIIDTVNSL